MKLNDATIEALRPEPVPLDADWSTATLRSILATEPTAPRRRSTPRRAAIAIVAVTVTSGLGVGVAAATTGFTLGSFTDAFSYWGTTPVEGKPSVDPASAKRLVTAEGPDNSVFSVVGTGGEYACFTAVIESPASAKGNLPTSFTDITDNYCSDHPPYGDDAAFGLASISYGSEIAGYMASAGEAVQAVATAGDGTEYPALLVDGQFWGWFPKDQNLTLTGYAKDGTLVGQVRL
jgi:hypothetical protein